MVIVYGILQGNGNIIRMKCEMRNGYQCVPWHTVYRSIWNKGKAVW